MTRCNAFFMWILTIQTHKHTHTTSNRHEHFDLFNVLVSNSEITYWHLFWVQHNRVLLFMGVAVIGFVAINWKTLMTDRIRDTNRLSKSGRFTPASCSLSCRLCIVIFLFFSTIISHTCTAKVRRNKWCCTVTCIEYVHRELKEPVVSIRMSHNKHFKKVFL